MVPSFGIGCNCATCRRFPPGPGVRNKLFRNVVFLIDIRVTLWSNYCPVFNSGHTRLRRFTMVYKVTQHRSRESGREFLCGLHESRGARGRFRHEALLSSAPLVAASICCAIDSIPKLESMWQQFLSGDLVEQYWKMPPCCTQPWKANYLSYFVTTDESYWKTMHVGGAPPGGGGGGNDLAVRIKNCLAYLQCCHGVELELRCICNANRPTDKHA